MSSVLQYERMNLGAYKLREGVTPEIFNAYHTLDNMCLRKIDNEDYKR